MHLQVESDVRNGLSAMKYVVNHVDDFLSPGCAFFVALMQLVGGFAAEFFCVIYLCSINNPVDVIIRFVALASIAKVDDFYASALPDGNICKRNTGPLKIKNQRRDITQRKENGDSLPCQFYLMRFIYKTFRIYYCSFFFYFFPYTVIFVPYLVLS